MKPSLRFFVVALALFFAVHLGAQTTSLVQTVKRPDERLKTDVLVVVAHPDDEGGVTPYLARAIYDQHKKVAVVFATRGGSGGNDYSREHGPALADIREQEARQACAKLGITNVWFLDGKDTASQNVLNSLANWGHGANLEALVRIVRLTRPEVIISWLPGIFIGENHGDHQASGVLATEAFDLANDPTAFPAQVAGASKRLEVFLENLTPWQPKKLYFFSDADDQQQFAGTGPAYSVKEISPSQKKPYWRLAMDAATPHLTQFPEEIHQLTAMSDEQLNKFMDDPQHQWWTEPMTLIFGKAAVEGPANLTEDVFARVTAGTRITMNLHHVPTGFGVKEGAMELSGPWGFYWRFYAAHGLRDSLVVRDPELGIKGGAAFYVPLVVNHISENPESVKIEVEKPAGWKITYGEGLTLLPAERSTEIRVEISTPELSKDELKASQPQTVTVRCLREGKTTQEVKLRVRLLSSGLPQ